MKKIFILLVIISVAEKGACQSPGSSSASSQYIEGARLVIDVLQLFKKNNTDKAASLPQNKNAYCNFCLFNSDTTQKIKVTLLQRNTQNTDPIVMVIKQKDKECSLQIQCGVYNCKIETPDGKILSWGDMLINEREVSVSR